MPNLNDSFGVPNPTNSPIVAERPESALSGSPLVRLCASGFAPNRTLVWLGMKVGAGKARRLVDRGPATTLCEAVDVWGEPGGRNRFSIARSSTAFASGRVTMIRRSQKLGIA